VTRVIIRPAVKPRGGDCGLLAPGNKVMWGASKLSAATRIFLRLLADKTLPKALAASAKGPWGCLRGTPTPSGIPLHLGDEIPSRIPV